MGWEVLRRAAKRTQSAVVSELVRSARAPADGVPSLDVVMFHVKRHRIGMVVEVPAWSKRAMCCGHTVLFVDTDCSNVRYSGDLAWPST